MNLEKASAKPLAGLGAADLLLALQLAGQDDAREHRYAALLGYTHAPTPKLDKPGLIPAPSDKSGSHQAAATSANLPPRFRVRLHGLLEQPEVEQLPAPLDVPPASTGLSDADCGPRLPLAPIQLLPLVAPGRLWPALKKLIQAPGLGPLDLSALTCRIAQARLTSMLPRHRVPRAVDRVMVVLDLARHLLPLAPDMKLVAAELRHLASHSGMVGYTVAGHPEQVNGHWGAGPAAVDGKLPQASAMRVILISDLGLARRHPSGAYLAAWLKWIAGLERAGSQVRIVSPVSGITLNLPQVHTLAGGRLHRPARRGGHTPLAAALERLKCALACAVRVEPELLRAMRLTDPALAPYPELESLYRQDDEVTRSHDSILLPAAAARHRRAFAYWPVAAQRHVLGVLRCFHGGDYRAVEMTEILLWAAHASDTARAEEALAIQEAHDWYARFDQERLQAPASPNLRVFANAVWGVVAQDERAQASYSRWLTPLWALDDQRRREPAPPALDPADLRRVLGHEPAAASCWLVQQGDWLLAQPGPATPGQSPIAGPLPARMLRIRQAGMEQAWTYTGQACSLARLSAGRLDLWLDHERLRIGDLAIPWWALEAGRDREGAYVLMPSVSGPPWRFALPFTALDKAPLFEVGLGKGGRGRIAWTEYVDEIGPYVELALGGVTQRLRWIPPGDFLMGSPEGEPESYDNEHPRHRVILSQGYWLADTACTQALWSAVMSGNPSHFKDDPENPVDSVSWNDIQDFLAWLGAATGTEPGLPSEAEWEYAYRAGTQTPFWWGDRLTPADANYDGNHPYNEGEKGEYRQRTLPVKSFIPNPWGLWQMHGNVWEWCRDGLRKYTDGVAVDPEGPPGGLRALRGGSWFNLGRSLRAANRGDGEPFFRNHGLGFRFLLRSLDSGARRAGN